jgi:type IV pilus assembly protein PilC
MPVYKYVATNSEGVRRTGIVDARNQDLAVGLIKQQGLYVVSLAEKENSVFDSLLDFRGVPTSELVGFTRQFSTMISAGLPLSRALDVLTQQSESKLLKKVLYDVLRSVEGGSSLSEALGRYPRVFSPTYQALVAAGESSGNLDVILSRLATRMEAERELNAKFKGAMIYPAIVLLAMVGVFFLLMIFVIPRLAEMYTNLGVELPIITQVMIAVSNFMVANVILILVAMVGVFFGIRAFLQSETGHQMFSAVLFKVPVFGKINRMKEIDQFMSTLSLLLSSAVPIVESLHIVSDVVRSNAYKRAAMEAANQVEKGNDLATYFKSNPIFPPLVGQMSGVGQETGKMSEVLEKVSSYFQGEIDHLVKGLSAALEPLILILLGAMVGFLILSIITPIYKITSAI